MRDRTADDEASQDDGYARLYAYDGTGDVRWTHDTLANGLEGMLRSVTATDDTVYYGASSSGSSQEQRPIVRALDADSGDPRWEYEFDQGDVRHLSVHDDRLYVGNVFDAYRLDAATGELVSERDHKLYPGRVPTEDGLVYPVLRRARAYDPAASETDWERELERPAETPASLADGTLYFGAGAGFVTALDVDDGSRVWNVQLPGVPDRRPVVGERVVWVTVDSGRIYALRRTDGTRLAEYDPESNVTLRAVGSLVRAPFEAERTVHEVVPEAVTDGGMRLRRAWTLPDGAEVDVTADGRFVGRSGTSVTAVDVDGELVWSGTFERGHHPTFFDGSGYASNDQSVFVGTRYMG